MNIIDIHTHGIGGYDTRGATLEAILEIAGIHGSHGVSAILPTIYSASIEEMRADMVAVKQAMSRKAEGVRRKGSKNDSRLPTHASRLIGVHLEGPFLNPARCGVLDGASFLAPTARSLKKLIEGFEDIVKIITIAPELKGAMKLIKMITDMGIIVSMGHSDATYAEAEAGFHAGAKGITHIFNAMRGIHHREPGIAGFGLLNRDIFIEVIADPSHLSPKIIALIFEVKDLKRIILVSDTVKGTKSSSAQNGVRDKGGNLVGGSMTIPETSRRLISMGLKEKVVMDCISKNPAEYLNELVRNKH